LADIGADDKETARVIGIHDGARAVGYDSALVDVATAIGRMARARKAVAGDVDNYYALALAHVLTEIQALMADKRNK
jgi:hypothetical protein